MDSITITSLILDKFYALLGHGCRLAFSALAPKRLSANRQMSDTNLVLFSGQRGAKMMQAVLLSIHRNWEKIPHLTVVSDGTPLSVLEASLQFWPFPYELKSWEDNAAWHLARGRQSLVDFARINPYARKLLVVLAEAEQKPVFYCDTDVLWFDEPRLPVPAPAPGFTMRISHDNKHSYHLPALRGLNRGDQLEKPALNCGVVYLSGSVYEHYPGFEELMQFMKIFNEPFAEQTTFALLADRFGDTWTPEEIIATIDDIRWPLLPSYLFSGDQLARHHVATKKSWFWRDALFIILSKNKKQRRAAAV